MSAASQTPTVLKPRLIVGLGNPGKEYENTRHNIGFMVVDALAVHFSATWSLQKQWTCFVAKFSGGWLLKPITFMNLSGQAVASACRFYKIEPQEVLSIYDDVDLPLGKLRLRLAGSAGGHNGVRSLLSHLGTDAFPRVKIGIGAEQGRPTGERMVGHVLGKFQEAEQPVVRDVVDRAVQAVQLSLTGGMDAAMNFFNRKEQTDTQPNNKA